MIFLCKIGKPAGVSTRRIWTGFSGNSMRGTRSLFRAGLSGTWGLCVMSARFLSLQWPGFHLCPSALSAGRDVSFVRLGIVRDAASVGVAGGGRNCQALRKMFRRHHPRHTYFITKDMRHAFHSTRLRGVLPALLVFLARSGHTVESVEPVDLDSQGNPVYCLSSYAPYIF